MNGPGVQGHWMYFINYINGMLELKSDPELEKIMDRSLDAVLNYHYNPDYQLNNEVLNHDLSRPDNDFNQYAITGHSIETLWMIMYEAIRRKDKKLFETSVERFKRHVEVGWDDVYGGGYMTLNHVDNNDWLLTKALWVNVEMLVGLMCILEHTGDQWAKDWFDRTYTYVLNKFSLKQYGFPLWIDRADRKVTFERHASRADNFHPPRHFMLNLLAIDRIIKREGKVSGMFG